MDLRLLLLLDDPDSRMLLEHKLSWHFGGLVVEDAPDSEALTRALDQGSFDVVVTERELGWTDGLSVLGEVKEYQPQCPVILCLDDEDDAVSMQALKAGAHQVLVKGPDHVLRLAATIRSAAKRSQRYRRAARVDSRLRRVLNRMKVGVFRASLAGQVQEMNPAALRILGMDSLAQARRINLHELLLAPEDHARTIGRLRQAGSFAGYERRVRMRDGVVRWIELSAMRSAAGDGDFVDGLIEDVTDRKQAEEEALDHLQQLAHLSRVSTLALLTAELAHSLNQPLTAIGALCGGFLHRLDAGRLDPADMRSTVSKIADQSLWMSQLVQRNREFLRDQSPWRSPIDLWPVVTQACEFVEHRMNRQRIRLRRDCDGRLPPVLVDPIQIQQVLLNLLCNAIDSIVADEGSTERQVHVHAWAQEDRVLLSVRDTGPGVAAEDQEKLFRPFFTSKGDGLGMGLAVSRQIVVSHGGRIWFAPHPARGATFHIALPAHAGAPQDHPHSVAAGFPGRVPNE